MTFTPWRGHSSTIRATSCAGPAGGAPCVTLGPKSFGKPAARQLNPSRRSMPSPALELRGADHDALGRWADPLCGAVR
jgi:hypothetical protein